MEQASQFWSQDQIAITIGAFVMLVLVLVILFASRKRCGQKIDPNLADDLAKGDYEAAAERELKAGRLRTAYDLFLRAHQPLRAAHIAVRQGRMQDAAESFEQAGEHERAAELYKQLGKTQKAEALLAEAAIAARKQEEPLGEDSGAALLDNEPIARPAPAARVRATTGAPPPPKPEPAVKPATPRVRSEQPLVKAMPTPLGSRAVSPDVAPSGASGTSGGKAEELALRYAADVAVADARLGPGIEELQGKLATWGGDGGAEGLLYQLGLVLVGAGRWGEARDAFQRAEKVAHGYRDAAARAQELVCWQAAVGESQLSLSRAGGGKPARYTLLGELGRGSMAVVYRAREESSGREVALKLMTAGDPSASAQLQRAARAAAQLDHRNIVTLLEVGEQQGKVIICLELVDGVTAAKLIEKNGKLTAEKAATVVGQVLDALAFAHERKTVHGDVKPANIMVGRDGTVKVMDFGLAKRVAGPDKTTFIEGSQAYMAPELLAGKHLDGRSDLFAVGVSLYEMLSGKLPFPGTARLEPAVPLQVQDSELPVALNGIVMRALELDMNRRFASASEMAIPLRAFLASTGPVGAMTSPSSNLAKPTRTSEPPAPPPPAPQVDKLDFDETKPVLQELSFDDAKQAAEETAPLDEGTPDLLDLSFGDAKPTAEPPPPDSAKPAAHTLSFGSVKVATRPQSVVEVKPPAVPFSLDEAESGPVSSPIIEGIPETIPPQSNSTPRSPTSVASSSVGSYRMVRPSQPDVFTPPPSTRETTPGPTPNSGSGERTGGVPPQKTPAPTLKLGTKPGSSERRQYNSPVPATGTRSPKTPTPAPRTSPDGTKPGPGSQGSGK